MIVNIGTPHNGDFTSEYIVSLLLLQNQAQISGKFSVRVNLYETCLVHKGRNDIFADCQDDYLMFIDTDIAFPKDGVEKLIASGKDIIGGLYHSRKAPHMPLVYKEKEGKYVNIEKWEDKPFEVDSIATGFLLISKKVIDTFKEKKVIPFDFIRFEDGFELGEDMAFCRRAKELGFSVWCDPSIKLYHIGKDVIGTNNYLAYKQINEGV